MTPSEIRLFSANEQTLLVSTEPKRLEELAEDELADLLTRVRRLRNKYSDLYRNQGRRSVKSSGKRYAATTSNQRTARQAEVAEDALSRVARYLSRAARRSANDLKAERITAARSEPSSGVVSTSATKKPPSARSAEASKPTVSGARVGSTSARKKRNQVTTDRR